MAETSEEQAHTNLGYFVHGAMQAYYLDGAPAEEVLAHIAWGAELAGVDLLTFVDGENE